MKFFCALWMLNFSWRGLPGGARAFRNRGVPPPGHGPWWPSLPATLTVVACVVDWHPPTVPKPCIFKGLQRHLCGVTICASGGACVSVSVRLAQRERVQCVMRMVLRGHVRAWMVTVRGWSPWMRYVRLTISRARRLGVHVVGEFPPPFPPFHSHAAPHNTPIDAVWMRRSKPLLFDHCSYSVEFARFVTSPTEEVT